MTSILTFAILCSSILKFVAIAQNCSDWQVRKDGVSLLSVDSSTGTVVASAFQGDGTLLGLEENAIISQTLDKISRMQFRQASSWHAFATSSILPVPLGLRAYQGHSAFDGQYVYFPPSAGNNGGVLRYNTLGTFIDPASWSSINISSLGGLTTRQFSSATFAFGFVYLAPGQDYVTGTYNAHMIRFNTSAESGFSDLANWEIFDAFSTDGVGCVGFGDAAQVGEYLYYASFLSACLLRFNTSGPFQSQSSWAAYSYSSTWSPSGFMTSNGQYLFLGPYPSIYVLRYDTNSSFTASSSYIYSDISSFGSPYPSGAGIISVGTYVYLAPAWSRKPILRYNVGLDFTATTSWESFDATYADNIATTAVGLFPLLSDGRYVYFNPSSSASAVVLRHDSLQPLNTPTSWTAFNAATVDNLSITYIAAGCCGNGYLYLMDSNGKALQVEF